MPAWLREAVAAGENPIRAVRSHLGLRLVDVAERAGMGVYGANSLGHIERGGQRLTPQMAERLREALGVEPAWLMIGGDLRR